MRVLRFLPGAAAIPRPGFVGKAVVKQLGGYAGQDAYALCATSSTANTTATAIPTVTVPGRATAATSASSHTLQRLSSHTAHTEPSCSSSSSLHTKYVMGNPSLLFLQHDSDTNVHAFPTPPPPPPPPRPSNSNTTIDVNGKLAQAGRPDGLVLALADGVHAWQKHNIDAGRFARELVTAVVTASTQLGGAHAGPLALLQHAHAQVVRKRGVMGSSTACIACLDGVERTLRVANLGDSRLVVVRNGKIILRSPVVEHHFGYPYQLGHHESADFPADSSVVWLDDIQEGDDIIVGSDGLFDNLNSERIEAIVGGAASKTSAAQIARELANGALYMSMSKTEQTPYSIAASSWLDLVYNGGKKDDICVVCVRVLGSNA